MFYKHVYHERLKFVNPISDNLIKEIKKEINFDFIKMYNELNIGMRNKFIERSLILKDDFNMNILIDYFLKLSEIVFIPPNKNIRDYSKQFDKLLGHYKYDSEIQKNICEKMNNIFAKYKFCNNETSFLEYIKKILFQDTNESGSYGFKENWTDNPFNEIFMKDKLLGGIEISKKNEEEQLRYFQNYTIMTKYKSIGYSKFKIEKESYLLNGIKYNVSNELTIAEEMLGNCRPGRFNECFICLEVYEFISDNDYNLHTFQSDGINKNISNSTPKKVTFENNVKVNIGDTLISKEFKNCYYFWYYKSFKSSSHRYLLRISPEMSDTKKIILKKDNLSKELKNLLKSFPNNDNNMIGVKELDKFYDYKEYDSDNRQFNLIANDFYDIGIELNL